MKTRFSKVKELWFISGLICGTILESCLSWSNGSEHIEWPWATKTTFITAIKSAYIVPMQVQGF